MPAVEITYNPDPFWHPYQVESGESLRLGLSLHGSEVIVTGWASNTFKFGVSVNVGIMVGFRVHVGPSVLVGILVGIFGRVGVKDGVNVGLSVGVAVGCAAPAHAASRKAASKKVIKRERDWLRDVIWITLLSEDLLQLYNLRICSFPPRGVYSG